MVTPLPCVYRWFKNRDAAEKNDGNTTQVKIAAHAPAAVQTTTVGRVTTQAATAKHAILLLDTLHRLTRKRNLSAAQLWADSGLPMLSFAPGERSSNEPIIIEEGDDPTIQPLTAFEEYLVSRDNSFPFHSALWITASGTVPTRTWFLAKLRTVFPTSSNIGGHSLRSAGATHFAIIGWPDDRIHALGRWSSDAFKIYIRSIQWPYRHY
ncbi:hypothetical protein EUX98_g7326 [Antrodiella citrinella]|uniref:Tyr recombinase domain-containing protein n=1 Tax=Antrodiella citrinella TaxID=2447956 RepID=A0A4S4MM36_9APHY|nr:hypothetical protein EUX98_g7326 [Antrodiella citrinella]